MKGLCILGSTGSVGRNCCHVLGPLADRFRVVALTAGGNLDVLTAQVTRFRPKIVSVRDGELAQELRERLKSKKFSADLKIVSGTCGMVEAATHPGVVMVVSASHGVTGLEATFQAVGAGKQIALANKETLVAAGPLVSHLAEKTGSEILPVDSEHNAIHQCLRAGRREEVHRLILTASGGPFLKTSQKQLEHMKPEQALRHPVWSMGRRITIDSATLMNKGFEIIEAHWLFHMPPDSIEVLIHPQSIVHSMVEFADGSVMAQMGAADMQVPIRYALTYPERLPSNGTGSSLQWEQVGRLEFHQPDKSRFPCLDLAREALAAGESMPCSLNAADEVAVEGFLKRGIKFTDIPRVVERVLRTCSVGRLGSLENVWECDREARARAGEYLRKGLG